MAGLKAGERNSFKYLYNKWSGKLYNFSMKISQGDKYLSEEIVQMVFLKVWENRTAIDCDRSFANYICTIAKNLLINLYHHRLQEILYQEKVMHNSYWEETTEKEVDYHLLDEYIQKLVSQLSPGRQEIYKLSRFEHLTNKEIAEKLQLSEKTVEAQLSKAHSFIREKIRQHYHLLVMICFYLTKY